MLRRSVMMVAVALVVLPACSSTPSPRPTAQRFLDAWARGDATSAAAITNDPSAAASALKDWRAALDVASARFTLGAGTRTPRFAASVDLRGLGPWRYQGVISLHRSKGAWLVDWSPAVLYPGMTGTQRLSRTRVLAARADVLDRNGTPIITAQPVVTVGVEPQRLGDPAPALAALQKTVGADPARVSALIKAARPDAFVPVITLRRPAFDAVKPVLNPIPGVVFQTGTLDLAPSPTFALAVLGKVGPATVESLRDAGPTALASDSLGLSGLEAVYQRHLAGSPSGAVSISEGGATVRQVFSVAGKPGQPVRTTLDPALQTAAEHALVGVGQPAAVVAVQPSTGDILAVANAPADSTYDRALAGQYPPGSSFKVVTAAALLQGGMTLETVVPCPARAVIGGKPFTNFEGEAPGPVPFITDFARSCNTAFASASSRVSAQALADEAGAFGFDTRWSLPLTAAPGRFPLPADTAESAAAAIGQGRVTASPLAMALVAATAAAGTWHAPTLVTDPPQASVSGPTITIAGPVDDALHQLMRSVVTSGTGVAANVAGTAVFGKTGTAEFGSATPPVTHAWFIGFRGDVAFAVLVEGGGVGGQVAAPIAARFLRAAGA